MIPLLSEKKFHDFQVCIVGCLIFRLVSTQTGEINKERIMANVKEAIGLKFPLYCLGFGYDVNFDFLTQMSLENAGLARRIYEDSDADLQLQVNDRESADCEFIRL